MEIDEMNSSELLVQIAEENQTRKIIQIVTEAIQEGKSLEDVKEKLEELLKK